VAGQDAETGVGVRAIGEVACSGLEIGETPIGEFPVLGVERSVDSAAGVLDEGVVGAGFVTVEVLRNPDETLHATRNWFGRIGSQNGDTKAVPGDVPAPATRLVFSELGIGGAGVEPWPVSSRFHLARAGFRLRCRVRNDPINDVTRTVGRRVRRVHFFSGLDWVFPACWMRDICRRVITVSSSFWRASAGEPPRKPCEAAHVSAAVSYIASISRMTSTSVAVWVRRSNKASLCKSGGGVSTCGLSGLGLSALGIFGLGLRAASFVLTVPC